jgi:CBS domain-containing protein
MLAVDAAKIMLKKNIGALPIIQDEKLIGIITRTDLLKTIS